VDALSLLSVWKAKTNEEEENPISSEKFVLP
jgi:hypothetical protein